MSRARPPLRLLPPVAICCALLVACDHGIDPLDRLPEISLSVIAPLPADATPGDGAVTYESDGSALTLTRAALVVRAVKLQPSGGDDCADGSEPQEDPCQQIEAGPYLLELPLEGDVETLVEAHLTPDTYDELELEIHRPLADEATDAAFLAANPDFEGVSVLVEGSWNGEAFVFTHGLSATKRRSLAPPLDATGGVEDANVTLLVDLASWFRRPGGTLVDPRTALQGGVNTNLVADNIGASIDAFDDDDRDGERGGG